MRAFIFISMLEICSYQDLEACLLEYRNLDIWILDENMNIAFF
jgi:hypothetical protein